MPTPGEVAEKPLVGAAEIAKRLGISTRTVKRFVADGYLPHYRVGRQIRFNVDEVLAAVRKDPR